MEDDRERLRKSGNFSFGKVGRNRENGEGGALMERLGVESGDYLSR